jgi:hypothetical protein
MFGASIRSVMNVRNLLVASPHSSIIRRDAAA